MCSGNLFDLHFETVVSASPMLGHRLESRSKIRNRQDLDMLHRIQQSSTTVLRDAAQQTCFAVCPLDVLVCRKHGKPEFHIIEMNGTGIGGVSNMPEKPVSAIATSLRQIAQSCYVSNAKLLLPVSGKKFKKSPSAE